MYLIRLVQERFPNGDVWTAQHPELPGCHAVGRDATSAVAELARVREAWIRRAAERGADVPEEPRDTKYHLVLAADATAKEAEQARQALEMARQTATEIGETVLLTYAG